MVVTKLNLYSAEVYPRTVKLNLFLKAVHPEHRYSNESERPE